MQHFDRHAIAEDFSVVAHEYASHAQLQARIGRALIARTAPFLHGDTLMVDVGAGPGNVTQEWPARAIALDMAFGMCAEAKKKRLLAIRGEAEQLPIKSGALDAVSSNLMLQWVESSAQFFAETARVLKPGGILAVTSFTEGTLVELASAFSAAGEKGRISEFTSTAKLLNQVRRAGLTILDDSCAVWPEEYEDVETLCHYIRAIGAKNKNIERPRGLLTPRKLADVVSHYPQHGKKIVASWRVQTIIARKHG